MATRRFTDEQRQEAIEILQRDYGVVEGTTIYNVTHSVSKSGMGGNYRFFLPVLDREGKPIILNITHLVARASGHNLKDKDGEWVVYVGGSGFNRPFQVVYDLSYRMFGDGYAINSHDL